MTEYNDLNSCCPGGDCEPGLPRRDFLKLSGLTVLGASLPIAASAEHRTAAQPADHFVPTDKKLKPDWVKTLFAKGERKVFRGPELRTIGMPCGGVAAGQLYVRGDGTLAYWWIGNNAHHSSYGGQTSINTSLGEYGVCYGTYRPPSPIAQGFAIRVHPERGEPMVHELSEKGFDDIGFIGEYPVATIDYRRKQPGYPLEIRSEVFSPFIPLNARDSAMPATLLRFTLKNTTQKNVSVSLTGWLQNMVLQAQREEMKATSRNRVVQTGDLTSVLMDATEPPQEKTVEPVVEMFEDFENGYGNWTVEGEAFGKEPAAGTLPGQQAVSGFNGKRLVNTFLRGDDTKGRALSKPFTVKLAYIAFLIGGGSDREKTALRLLVDGKPVRVATGRQNERLEPGFWDVAEFVGKEARLEIVDDATGGWGHINVDDIVFTNTPPKSDAIFSRQHPQFGNVALTALTPGAKAVAKIDSPEAWRQLLEDRKIPEAPASARSPLQTALLGAVTSDTTLQPGETKTLTFALSWFFPNRRQREDEGNGPGGKVGADGPVVGQMYSNWFTSALDVVQYVAENERRLVEETFAFRDTLYDTTLPYWLTQRLSMPLANMATEVYQWWKNGRVWCWEGVGCCTGCCGHVYNYAQATARLFPEMERSIRTMQDFLPGQGFIEATGAIGFRGVPNGFWAGDSQGGYILKAYREHLCSDSDAFLKRNWKPIRKALEFLLKEDGNDDGLLEGRQHNTYDIDFYGPNTMVGSLYIGALKAGARMARLMNEAAFAERCEQIAEKGVKQTMAQLWNGEYFIQKVDLKQHPKHQYGDGCLSDQLLGQWFAHQLDLGYLYPRENVRKAMASVYTYNWAPDVGPQNRAHRPDRIFCSPGEAGLFTCTWPKSKHLGPESVLYRDEVWTGIEYQVAAHLLYEGYPTEALAIIRGIHERYDGVKHNPWNEIECGDHYARAMGSWSVLLAASGFLHDGPAGRLGFAPNLTPEDFRSFFSASEGWGTFAQSRKNGEQRETVTVKWGRLRLKELVFEAKDAKQATVTVNGNPISTTLRSEGSRVTLTLEKETAVEKGQTLEVRLRP
jgi:non-lysosomal glucosylceramidase